MSLDSNYRQDETQLFGFNITLPGGTGTFDNSDVLSFYFIEDIFSFSMVGKITILDKYGMLEHGPLVGGEKITVTYGESAKEQELFIYKIAKVAEYVLPNMYGANVLDLVLVDKYFPLLTQKRYSYSWDNEKIGDVIKKIATDILKVDSFKEFEDPREKISFCMPYWTAGETLKWLMKRCSSKETDCPGYLLYNSTNGVNFTTLEKLMQNKDKDPNIYLFEDKSQFYLNKIISWSHSGMDSHGLQDIAGSYRVGYDPMQKKLLFNNYKYSDAIKKFTMLGKKTLFSSDIDETQIRYKYEAETDPKVLDNIYHNDFIKRYSTQHTFSLTVKGSENRYAGQMIEVEWPSTFDEEKYNRGYAGKYLVKSVTHGFSAAKKPTFTQKLVVIKNGYEDNDSDVEGSAKTNLDNLTLGS